MMGAQLHERAVDRAVEIGRGCPTSPMQWGNLGRAEAGACRELNFEYPEGAGVPRGMKAAAAADGVRNVPNGVRLKLQRSGGCPVSPGPVAGWRQRTRNYAPVGASELLAGGRPTLFIPGRADAAGHQQCAAHAAAAGRVATPPEARLAAFRIGPPNPAGWSDHQGGRHRVRGDGRSPLPELRRLGWRRVTYGGPCLRWPETHGYAGSRGRRLSLIKSTSLSLPPGSLLIVGGPTTRASVFTVARISLSRQPGSEPAQDFAKSFRLTASIIGVRHAQHGGVIDARSAEQALPEPGDSCRACG